MQVDDFQVWASGMEKLLKPAWAQKHLKLPGAGVGIESLLTISDVYDIVRDGRTRVPQVVLVANGSGVQPLSRYTEARKINDTVAPGFLRLDEVRKILDEGASVKLNELHDYHRAVGRLAEILTERFWLGCRAQAFLTPPGGTGSNLHQEFAHVLVVQLIGAKRWNVYEHFEGVEHFGAVEAPAGAEPSRLTLRRGDVLYMPPGTPHQVVGCDDQEWSLHAVFGFEPFMLHDMLRRRLQGFINRTISNREVPANGDAGREMLIAAAAQVADMFESNTWEDFPPAFNKDTRHHEALSRSLGLSDM